MTRRRGVGKAGIARGVENTIVPGPSVRSTTLQRNNLTNRHLTFFLEDIVELTDGYPC
jgi:hypothetical protein